MGEVGGQLCTVRKLRRRGCRGQSAGIPGLRDTCCLASPDHLSFYNGLDLKKNKNKNQTNETPKMLTGNRSKHSKVSWRRGRSPSAVMTGQPGTADEHAEGPDALLPWVRLQCPLPKYTGIPRSAPPPGRTRLLPSPAGALLAWLLATGQSSPSRSSFTWQPRALCGDLRDFVKYARR